MHGIVGTALKIRTNIKLVRCITLPSQKSNQNKGNFVPVYKFPYIVSFSLVNRLKFYQTALTAVSIPVTICLNQLNQMSSDTVQFTAALGLTGCLTLYSLGYLTQNFIGFIYYDEGKNITKISYIDFWGRRKDIDIPTQDIIPLNELPVKPLDGLYLTVRRFSTEDTLKLNLRFGVVLDKEKIKQVM